MEVQYPFTDVYPSTYQLSSLPSLSAAAFFFYELSEYVLKRANTDLAEAGSVSIRESPRA